MTAKILIADDHPLFRAAMRQALYDIVGDTIVEVASFFEALEKLQSDNTFELVFLDINMPGNEGLSGITELRTLYPDVLVVVVSAEERPAMIRRAVELGASGYIPKSTPLPVIAEAVNRVLEGEVWLPANLEAVIEEHKEPTYTAFAAKLALLTPHQFKVLKMIADGLLNKQIAYELSISESTVKQHVSQVLRKLNVINRTKAGVLYNQMMKTDE